MMQLLTAIETRAPRALPFGLAAVAEDCVPAVFAAVDIPEGTTITFSMLKQQSIERRFVTASTVTPDQASHVIGERSQLPFRTGDALLWSAFPPLSRR